MVNFAKKIIIIIAGIVFGYLIYYNVIMDIVSIMYGSGGSMYYIISIFLLLLSILCCSLVMSFIINRQLDRNLFIMISICYFSVMFFALFCRTAIAREFIWNPFESIKEIDSWRMCFQTFLNLAMFIPLGFYFKKIKNFKMVFIVAIFVSFAIELIQGLTQRGFFDTFDVMIYCLGIMIGYRISHVINK